MHLRNPFSRGDVPAAARPVSKREQTSAPMARVETGVGPDFVHSGDMQSSNVIFDVIGLTASGDEAQPRTGVVASEPVDVIDALYSQYFLALDNRHTAFTGDWVAPSMPVDLHAVASSNALRPATAESIETLIGGTHLLENAFGPLGLGEAPELVATEPIPDILKLFAPAEVQAAALRRPLPLPPALARREHHSVSIDSAMPVPHAVDSRKEAA